MNKKAVLTLCILAALLVTTVSSAFAATTRSTGQSGDYSLAVTWVSPASGTAVDANTPITVDIAYTQPPNAASVILIDLVGSEGDADCQDAFSAVSGSNYEHVSDAAGTVRYTLSAKFMSENVNFVNVQAAIYDAAGGGRPLVDVFGCNAPQLPSYTTSPAAPAQQIATPAPVATYFAALETGQLAGILSDVVVVYQYGEGSRWLSQAAAISELDIAASLAATHAVTYCEDIQATNGSQYECEMTMENAWRTALGLDTYRSRLTIFIEPDGTYSNVADSQNVSQFIADRDQVNAFMVWLESNHPSVYAGLGSVYSADFIRTISHTNLLPYAQEWSAP